MSTAWSLFLMLTIGVASFAVGRGTGHSAGVAAAEAQADRQTVSSLTLLIDANRQLVDDAHAASHGMRQAVNTMVTTQRKTTLELRDVLASTSDDRLLCRFDADSMRIIRAARNRAADLAAGGVRNAMSGTAGTDR